MSLVGLFVLCGSRYDGCSHDNGTLGERGNGVGALSLPSSLSFFVPLLPLFLLGRKGAIVLFGRWGRRWRDETYFVARAGEQGRSQDPGTGGGRKQLCKRPVLRRSTPTTSAPASSDVVNPPSPLPRMQQQHHCMLSRPRYIPPRPPFPSSVGREVGGARGGDGG